MVPSERLPLRLILLWSSLLLWALSVTSSRETTSDRVDVVISVAFVGFWGLGDSIHWVACCLVYGSPVLVKILICQLDGLRAVKVFCFVVYRPPDLCWEFSKHHLFYYVVHRDCAHALLDEGEHLGREFAFALDAVKYDARLLRFCAAIPIAQVCFECGPVFGGTVAEQKFIDLRICVDGELWLNKGELVLWVGHS